MVVITGGAWQGMDVFGKSLLTKELPCIVDCKENDEAILQADLILNLEAFVAKLVREKKDPYAFAEELIRRNPEAVVTVQEMGCGIVPMDAFEREWREMTGRVSCVLAKEAKEVYRVICGVPSRLKP